MAAAIKNATIKKTGTGRYLVTLDDKLCFGHIEGLHFLIAETRTEAKQEALTATPCYCPECMDPDHPDFDNLGEHY